jgi:hypothetical protein
LSLRDALGRLRRRRFQVLFAALAATLLVGPALRRPTLPGDVLEAFLLVTLLAAGLAGLGLGHGRAIVALLALLGVSRAFHGIYGGTLALAAGDGLWALGLVLAGAAALRATLREGGVTAERLYAAASVYLLAGLAFAAVYQGLWQLDPGTFHVGGAPAALPDLGTAIYFSFVTLATLGYGDVVPATPLARSLAISEAVGAQLFVAILIARLVSLRPPPSG